MTRVLAILLTVVASLASIALLWTEAIPLGIPGEWTWARLSYSAAGITWAAVATLLSGAVYAGVVWFGERDLESQPAWRVGVLLGLLTAAGFVWLWGVQSAAIDGVGIGKSPNVLFYRRTEGYYWQARYEVTSFAEFLAGYEDLLAERDYLHIGTHPPGLTLLYCGLLDWCRSSPRLVEMLPMTMPADVQGTLDVMQSQTQSNGGEFTDVDAACLWLAVLLTQAAAAATVIPLYRYLRLSSSRTAAWRAAAFWPLAPAIAAFLPKSDVLYPVIGMTAAWLIRSAWFRCRDKLRITGLICALLGSAALVGGLLLSLAFLPVIALIGMQWLCDVLAEGRPDRSTAVRAIHELTVAIALFGSFLIALGGVLSLCGHHGMNLLNVWKWNFSNHALFYEHNVRTYWKWLLVNPLELTLAAGVPIIALVKWGSLQRVCEWRSWLSSPVVPFTVVWVLLWLSGKNMGEAARLWIPLLPWLVASTVNAFTAASDPTLHDAAPASPPIGRLLWLGFLGLQLVVGTLTVLRVDGFHFTELVRP